MTLMGSSLFRRSWASANSAVAAVIADMVVRGVVDYGFVVNVVNVRYIHVIHRAVVVEASVIPISALIADATVAEAIVDAPVKADIRAPVAFIPGKGIATPAPITGRPEKSNFGSHHPRTRHPKIAFLSISPVAGRPHIAVSWGHRLGIDRKRGRSDRDGHAELREQGSWDG